MQMLIRRKTARLAWLAGGVVFGFLGGCAPGPATPADEQIGSNHAGLTAAQCRHFAASGKVTICHRTHAAGHQYRILEVSEHACINAHAAHAGDYVAVDDPTCQGGGCLPAGAPCDATVPCCDGASCQNGVCAAICVPGAFRYETRPYTAGVVPQSSEAAVAAFHGAPADAPGYGSTTLATLTNLSNQLVFQGTDREIGYHVRATFLVREADAGTWRFRIGADFGLGGTLLVDGEAIAFRAADMWWDGRFDDPSQYLEGSVSLGAGVHTVDVYGFENCCDGPSRMEYQSPTSGTWTVFSTSTLETCCAADY
jgi:hypothetical protein